MLHYELLVIVFQQNHHDTMTLVSSTDPTVETLRLGAVDVALDHVLEMLRLMLHQRTSTKPTERVFYGQNTSTSRKHTYIILTPLNPTFV